MSVVVASSVVSPISFLTVKQQVRQTYVRTNLLEQQQQQQKSMLMCELSI